jgi:metallo-beta-lactamase family protein
MAKSKKAEDIKIKIQFIGATDEVTGSCTYIQVDGINILVDFGLIQNNELTIDQLYRLNSKELPLPMSKIDYVIILHPHFDHCSRTPILSNSEFTGKIIATTLTAKLMNLILTDSAHIMNREVTRVNKKRTVKKLSPLYTKSDVEYIMTFVQGYDFNKEIILNSKTKITLLPASHISGAAMLYLEFQESEYVKKRILITSDTSGIDRDVPFTMKPNIEKLKVDLIVSESTYGDREHDNINPEEQLEKCIRDTILDKKKTIVIPSFAMSRCTNIILMLYNLFNKYKEFQDIELYLASPMSINAHKIIGEDESFDFYDKQWSQYKDLFKWDKIQMIDDFEIVQSKLINDTPKLIISASGMCDNGFVKYIISKYLPIKDNKILISGYQANGSLGRKLIDGITKTVTIDGIAVPIKADIEMLKKMSSHASKSELVNLLKTVEKKKVKKIALVHGQQEAKESLREALKKEFDCEIIIPKENMIVKI